MEAATGLDSLLEPLSLCLDADAFRIDPQVLARMEALGERANEGSLTAEERSEYEALINAADFISILRLKAERHLARITKLEVDAGTRLLVRHRAGDRCEYCRLRQEHSAALHQIEHIVAQQPGGGDDTENLDLACHRCNLHTGPNLSGIDPITGVVEVLFHPSRRRFNVAQEHPGHFASSE